MRFCQNCKANWEDEDIEDEAEITDCPNCGRGYDDADADFLICHHCGYDVEKGKVDERKIKRSLKGYGIDPDVKLDDWT